MSNALSIASVTALLKDLLNDGLINQNLDSLFNFQVTAQPLDRVSVTTNGQNTNLLNMFLYRVSPNTGWSNMCYPARSSSGGTVDNPLLALNLHYMLSALAADDLNAETLLGYGMQILHETPVLDRDAIRRALGAGGALTGAILPQTFQELSPAQLADQFEQIKIRPYYVDMEEMSKLWTAMNTPLRMSFLYEVSVVLIESQSSTRSSLPVRGPTDTLPDGRAIFVRQLHRPTIARILSQGPSDTEPSGIRQISHGDELVIEGSGLQGEITVVGIGEQEAMPTMVSDQQIRVAVPAGLHPGVTSVQVIHRIGKRPPSTETMPGESSNLMVFLLHPSFAQPNPVTLSNIELEDDAVPLGPIGGRIQIDFDHVVGGRQRLEVLLNEFQPPNTRVAFAYTFNATMLPDPVPLQVTERDFDFRQVEQGTYLLRVRVDGVESLIEMTAGAFSGPLVVLLP